MDLYKTNGSSPPKPARWYVLLGLGAIAATWLAALIITLIWWSR